MPITPEQARAMQQRCDANRKLKSMEVSDAELREKYGIKPPPILREADLHQQIIDECRQRGWIPLHGAMHVRAMRPAGEPDFVIVADNGVTLFVECKARLGKLSPDQFAMKHHLEKLKARYAVVRSFEEFLQFITFHTA